ncbi:unnamed protein product [Rangifer tarandus platyrhynchus]|uniref:Uncharacterized protein n=1 Tax=Rangifer tarandus platyrhynchus TaxID=3082113 RepID=A0AC59YF35_RANTA
MVTVSTWDRPQPWAGGHQSPFFTRPLSPNSLPFSLTSLMIQGAWFSLTPQADRSWAQSLLHVAALTFAHRLPLSVPLDSLSTLCTHKEPCFSPGSLPIPVGIRRLSDMALKQREGSDPPVSSRGSDTEAGLEQVRPSGKKTPESGDPGSSRSTA